MIWNCSDGGDTGSLKDLGQVCRVQMIVRVQNEIYDEMSVLWTSDENKGVIRNKGVMRKFRKQRVWDR